MPPVMLRTVALCVAVAAIVAAGFPSTISAQSDETETAGRIVARRLVEGRTEFGWQRSGGGW